MEQQYVMGHETQHTVPFSHFSFGLLQKLLTYYHQQLSLLTLLIPWTFKGYIIPDFIPVYQAPQTWIAG